MAPSAELVTRRAIPRTARSQSHLHVPLSEGEVLGIQPVSEAKIGQSSRRVSRLQQRTTDHEGGGHAFRAPEKVQGPLTFKPRLLYRRVNQHLLNIVTGSKDVRAPVTEIDTDELVLPMESP